MRVDLRTHLARPLREHFLRAGRLTEARGERRVELLPDPRHAEEHRRARVLEVVGHVVDRLGEVDRATRRGRHVQRAHLLRDVRQRQVRQRHVLRAPAAEIEQRARRPREVAMRQHHALGRAGRARRVDQRRERVLLERIDALVHVVAPLSVPIAGLAALRGEPGGRAAHHHDPLEQRQLRALGLHLRELIGILDENRERLRMVHDVLHLVGRARRVDAGRHAARHHRRVIEDRPLGAVEAEDRDLAAARQSERDQRARCGADLIRIRAPRRRLPAAVHLRLVRDRGRLLGRPLQHAMRDRVHQSFFFSLPGKYCVERFEPLVLSSPSAIILRIGSARSFVVVLSCLLICSMRRPGCFATNAAN